MFATNTVSVFIGSRGRSYYSIHGANVETDPPMYYDIEFPLPLALKIETSDEYENSTIGHRRCGQCQDNGMYRNIAVTMCSRCIQEFPEYVCDCINRNVHFGDYVLQSDHLDNMRHLSCGPNCIWFAENAIYGSMNFREIGLSRFHQRGWTRNFIALLRGRENTEEFLQQEPHEETKISEDDDSEETLLAATDETTETEIITGYDTEEEGEIRETAVPQEEPITDSLSDEEQAILNEFSCAIDQILTSDFM